MPRRKSSSNHSSQDEVVNAEWNNDELTSMSAVVQDVKEDVEEVESESLAAQDNNIHEHSPGSIEDSSGVHNQLGRRCEIGDADSFEDKAGSEDKRNLSLEALFQAAHTELQNFSKHSEEIGECSKSQSNSVFPDAASCISDVDDSVSIVIQTPSGEKVTGKLVKVINKKGQQKLKIRTSGPATAMLSDMQLISNSSPQSSVEVLSSPLVLNAPSLDSNTESLSPLTPKTPGLVNVQGIMVQPKPNVIPKFTETHSGGRKRKHPEKPGKHICPYCARRCAKPSVLVKHIRAHTGERPYPCVPCGFSFKTKSNLYKHCKSRSHAMKVGSKSGTEDVEMSTEMEIPVLQGYEDDDEEGDDEEEDEVRQSDGDALSSLSVPSMLTEKSAASNHTTQTIATAVPVQQVYTMASEVITNNDPLSVTCTIAEASNPIWVMDPVPSSEGTMVIGAHSAKVALPTPQSKAPVVIQASESTNIQSPMLSPGMGSHPKLESMLVTGSTVLGTPEACSDGTATCRSARPPSLSAIKKHLTPDGLLDHISWLISSNEAIIDTPMAEAPRPKRLPMSRQGSDNSNLQVTHSSAVLSRSVTDPTSGRSSHVLQRQASVCELSPAPTSMIIPMPNQPSLDAPSMVQMAGEGGQQQLVFLGLAEPSDQPPGSISQEMSSNQVEVLTVVPQSVKMPPIVGSPATSLPSEIKIQFKLPRKSEDDGQVTEQSDGRSDLNPEGSAIKDLLLQDKSQKFTPEGGEVIHVIDKVPAESSGEGTLTCPMCGFSASCQEDFDSHRMNSCPSQGLLVVVHEDGTEETILVTIGEQEVMTGGDDIHVATTPNPPQAITGHQVQGLPAPKATASLKTIPPCKADHLKPDLKLSIPSYSQDLGSLQNGLSVMSANQCRISSTPDTGETINPSPIPDWKLQLKGHLLMKRSLSVERLLSEEKEEKNKLESLSVDTKASLGHPNILKRSHSADVNSVTTPTKRRILPEITESEDCNMTYESEESSKELASPVCRTIVITDTDDKQSPCAPALCVAVVKQVSEMDTSSVITAPCIRLHGYSAPLPPVLAIPSILAEKIPGFPRKAEDAVSDVECEKALENQNKLSPVLIETSEEVTIEDVAETESDAAVVRKTDSAPASIIHEHVMVRLKLDSGEIDGKMTAALMLLGNSLPSLRSVAYSTFCSVLKPQPCYVEQGPNDKISMYSNWKTAIGSVNIMGLSIKEVLSLYKTQFFDPNPVYCNSQITKLKSALLTHSSYWTAKKDGSKSKQKCDKILQASSPGNESKLRTLTQIPDLIFTDSSCQEDVPLGMVQSVVQTENRSSSSGRKKLHQILVDRVSHSNQQRVKICPGGYKSNEDYIYVRGRGRGKYVCEECGIRCKKPSMLKKHIRTHTDLRPYRCQFCCFKFKTKGNLTKHMKSKAHHKRCVDLGISPVPVYIDSTNVDPEALTEQGHISKDNYEGEGQMSDVEDEVEGDEEEDDEEDEEVEQEELEVEVKTVEVHSEVSGGGLQDLPHYREVSGGGLQDLPHYREVSGGGLQDLPHYIAIQSDQVAKPSLFCISSGGQTIFHLDSTAQSGIGAGDGGQAGSPRASIDKEIAASLLDLSKGTDDLTTTFKSCAGDSRLTHLIGALISRTTEADTAPLGDINSKGDDLSVKDVAGGVSSEPSYMTGFRPPLLIVSSSDLIKVTGDPLKAKTVVMPNFNSKLTGTITTTTITNATLNCGTTVQPPLVCGAVATSCLTSPSEMNPSTKFATGNTKAPFEIIPVPGKVSDVTDCQNGKYKCGVCEAEFNQAHQLTLHNKIHLIECLHKCNDCALAFRTKPLLSKHLRSERHQAKVKLKTHFGVNQGSIETNEPRPFKCDDCNVAFRFHGHLSKHLRSRMHILELEMLGKLPAGSAEKLESQDLGDLSTLDSQSNLESLHSMLAFADGQSRSEEVTNYCCQPCLLTFENKFQLNTHLASDEHLVVVGGPLEGQVERLDTKTESPRQSASASESRVEERLVCGTCQLTCMNEESLRKHSKTAHGTQTPSEDITSGNRPAEVTSLIGEVTNRTRSSDKIPTLKHGMLTRMRRLAYMCDICGDAFTNEQDLVTHVSTHSLVKPSVSAELRPYVCEYCDGGFPSMQSLRIHLTTHKEERPYVCGMCGAQFASADHLKQHSITHIDQSSYPSGIVVCGEEKASEVGGVMCVGVGSGEVGVVEEELVVEDGIITDDTMVHHVIMDPTELSQHQLQDQQLSEHQQQDQQLSEYQIQEPNLAENRNPVSVRDNQPVVGQGRLLLPSDTHSATGDAPKEGENEGSSQRLTSSISYSHDLTGGSDVVTVDNDDPHTVSDRHPNSHLS